MTFTLFPRSGNVYHSSMIALLKVGLRRQHMISGNENAEHQDQELYFHSRKVVCKRIKGLSDV